MSRVVFRSVTPLLPAGGNLAAAVEYYTQALGFRVLWHSDTMAGIERDGVRFNLVENDTVAWVENSSHSIGVSDLEAWYAELHAVPGRRGPLEMKPWGRREFHLVTPSGVCLQFFQQD